VLVVCPDAGVRTAFRQVRDFLEPPFRVRRPPGALDLPADGQGTLVFHDIAALTLPQQLTLYDWLGRTGMEARVVSMAGSPMWPLVTLGRFHEGLFYRLNTISFVARSSETRAQPMR
jgi:DNA-binding NtrC family response regulator